MSGPLLRDPVTFEVFRRGLQYLVDEMALVMAQTAHSLTASSALDFSTALCDPVGRVLAQSNTISFHQGTMSDAAAEVCARFQGRIGPGDVFIFNETDAVAQHLPDIYLVKPCYADQELLGFAVCVSHHIDIGGRVPGSMAPDSVEVFEEGLMIPLVKLYDSGQLDETLKELILKNVRLPDLVWGDLEAQLVACIRGETGLVALARRHSSAGLRALAQELLGYTERLLRAAISSIPDGRYEFEDWLDDDGAGNGPVRLYVAASVANGSIVVDYTGSAAQVRSAINCHAGNIRAKVYAVLGATFFTYDIPHNHGFYSPINVITPPGTVVNPGRGAARAARAMVGAKAAEALIGALAQAVPGLPAGGDGGPHKVNFSGVNEKGMSFVTDGVPPVSGNSGGRLGLDGIEGITSFANMSNSAFTPVEDIEKTLGVRVERQEFLQDATGAGQWRGGLGFVTDVRFIAPEGMIVWRTARRTFHPYGLHGGKPGTPASALILNPGLPDEQLLPTFGKMRIKRNDLIRFVMPGGGGYGDPSLREFTAILDDVLDEKISIEHARREYNVDIDVGPLQRIVARTSKPSTETGGSTHGDVQRGRDLKA